MPRVTSSAHPWHTTWSLVFLALLMLAHAAIAVVALIHALDYEPLMSPLGMALFVLLAMALSIVALLGWDLLAKYAFSRRLPQGAYDNTVLNFATALAFKTTLVLVALFTVLAFLVYVGKYGGDYSVPFGSCNPSDCVSYKRWLSVNRLALLASASLLAFGVSTLTVYVSEDVRQSDDWRLRHKRTA